MSGKVLHFPQQAVTPASERPAAPIVGRDTELAVLHQRLEAVLQGQRQVVFLAGEPGIGKTALVDAFLAQLRDRADIRITSGQCIEQYGPGEAYLPLLEATTRLCRPPGSEQRIAALKRYAPSWLAQLPGLLEPQESALLQQQVQGTSRERMLREMAEAAEQFCVRRSLVLVLEDLHWSDTATLEWIAYIARRRAPVKLLILGTYRPADVLARSHPLQGVVQELRAREQCEELRLAPLAEDAITEYLRGRFGQLALPEALTATLARRTGGNPLFIVNTVEDLLRQDILVEDAGQWTVRADKVKEVSESIPDTLRQLIEQQIERLEKQDQLLLEVASVSGMEFATAAVAAGLPIAIEAVEEQCEQLAHKGQFIRRAGVEDWPDGALSGRYGFVHALYQQVAYERMAEARRVRLHRALGARKEQAYGKRAGEIAGELAAHFAAGRDPQRAVTYSRQAAETAARRHAHPEAVRHLGQGLTFLQLLPDTPERAHQELMLQLALGEQLTTLKGFGVVEVEQAFARARELCRQLGETPQLFRVLLGLWAFYVERAKLTTARELAEHLLRLAQQVQSAGLLVWAHLTMGITLHFAGEQAFARQHLEQSLALYDPQQFRAPDSPYDPGVLSLATLGPVLWLLGYPHQALEQSQQGLTLARESAHPYNLVYALTLVSRTELLRGEQQAVHARQEELLVFCREHEFVSYLALSLIVRGWLLTEQGQREAGIEQMHQELSAWRATGAESARPYYLALLAETHGKAGEPEEGLAVLAECWEWMGETGGRVFEAELYRLKGELLLQKGARDWGIGTGEEEKRKSTEGNTRQVEGLRLKAEGSSSFSPSSLQPAAYSLSQDSALSTQHLSSLTPNPQPPVPSMFRREGEYWTLAFEGVSCRVRDMRGLHYLARLLQHPHEELHVLRLVTGDKIPTDVDQRGLSTPRGVDDHADAESASGFTDLGELLDPQARVAYRRRIKDLQEELEEAARCNDQGRVGQLRDELDFLTQELAQAVGLGGRARKAGSPMERARVTVTKAIKNTLKKINKHHPALGRHLALTIKTGTYCSYTPDSRLPITWQS